MRGFINLKAIDRLKQLSQIVDDLSPDELYRIVKGIGMNDENMNQILTDIERDEAISKRITPSDIDEIEKMAQTVRMLQEKVYPFVDTPTRSRLQTIPFDLKVVAHTLRRHIGYDKGWV